MTKSAVVAERVQLANGIWSRFWGLMGRRNLEDGAGMLLSPCSSVHTAFMQFPIDVVFLDHEGRVVKVVSDLKAFRMAAVLRGARQVLELPAGAVERIGVEPGDRLDVAPAAPDPDRPP